MRYHIILVLAAIFLINAAPKPDDAKNSVRIVSAGGSSMTCSFPQKVESLDSRRSIKVTITNRWQGSAQTGVINQNYVLGPSESAGIGCRMTSGSQVATVTNEFTIANAVFIN